jgi:hypothetical protein
MRKVLRFFLVPLGAWCFLMVPLMLEYFIIVFLILAAGALWYGYAHLPTVQIVDETPDVTYDTNTGKAWTIKTRVDAAATIIAAPPDDPEQIVMYRIAQLRAEGEAASTRIVWTSVGGRTVFSVQVRRGNGAIEKPAENARMKRFV